ncbi:MAG: electron transfer flavoprotein subunit alpha/FixB family protein [Candidatus Dormibacteria bacterium]
MAEILVYCELSQGQPTPGSLEALTLARRLGEVAAVVLDPDASSVVATLGEYGAATVYSSTEAAFREHVAQPAAATLAALVEQRQPGLVLFPASYDGRDICAHLSARLGLTVAANATSVEGSGSGFTVQSSIFGATQNVSTELLRPSPCVLLRPKSVTAEAAGTGQPQVVALEVPADAPRGARRVESVAAQAAGPDLEEAKVVVSAGRGLQDPSNFQLVERLAALLHGAPGASRAVVDAGWVPYALQVGQTGKTVKPDVYIACGISGAMQHTVGMKGARHIIAVNRDREAPIFKLCDLGVVGDVLKVLPALITELEARGLKA